MSSGTAAGRLILPTPYACGGLGALCRPSLLAATLTTKASSGAHCRHIILTFASQHHPMKTLLLYIATAIAEIVGCYLPYLWLKEGKSVMLLIPAAVSLAIFARLLTLHPSAAGRVYAAYGGVYITAALVWLWAVEGMRPTGWDWAGVSFSLIGMAIIAFQPR